MALIIAIAGGSGSGKSFIAERVQESLKEECGIVCQDWFFKEYSQIPKDSEGLRNFDLPENFEWPMIREVLEKLREGKDCKVPKFAHLDGRKGFKNFKARQVIIFEGFLATANPRINRLFDLKVFVNAPENERFERRLARDVKERKIPEELVRRHWKKQVLDCHAKFVQPQEKIADIAIDGMDNCAFKKVLEKIKELREKQEPI